MDRVKRIWYLSPMRAAKVQASLRIRAVSPEPPLLAHRSNESRGTFRQKARSLAPLNGWACAVKICHDGMLEDINSLGGAHMSQYYYALLGSVKIFKKINIVTRPRRSTTDLKMVTIKFFRNMSKRFSFIRPKKYMYVSGFSSEKN